MIRIFLTAFRLNLTYLINIAMMVAVCTPSLTPQMASNTSILSLRQIIATGLSPFSTNQTSRQSGPSPQLCPPLGIASVMSLLTRPLVTDQRKQSAPSRKLQLSLLRTFRPTVNSRSSHSRSPTRSPPISTPFVLDPTSIKKRTLKAFLP
jgi:hypothetical protein